MVGAHMSQQPTVLYDTDCGFCRWTVAIILKWDRAEKLRTAEIQGATGERLLTGMSEATKLASWHFVTEQGEVYSAGSAFPHLFNLLPGGSVFSWLTSVFYRPTEFFYRLVADNRSTLSKFVPKSAKTKADRVVESRHTDV